MGQAAGRSWNREVRWMRSYQASPLPQGCLMSQRAKMCTKCAQNVPKSTKCSISAASWAVNITFDVLIVKTCSQLPGHEELRASSFQSCCEVLSPSYIFDKKQLKKCLSFKNTVSCFSGKLVSFYRYFLTPRNIHCRSKCMRSTGYTLTSLLFLQSYVFLQP